MLEIKPVKYYRLARYPKGLYYENNKRKTGTLVTSSLTSVALMLLATACTEGIEPTSGVVGPPPLPPNYITENEARTIINKVFTINGIKLDTDIPISLGNDDNTPIKLNLDGLNEKLNAGYEYIFGDDATTFTTDVIEELNELNNDKTGPFIFTIIPPKSPEELESRTQEYITLLRAKGLL